MAWSRCLAAARQAPWLAALVVVAAGCTRSFFRERADRDVEGLLQEKGSDPRWAVQNWHAYPDPRARFADGDDPDHPKKPPDDPAAAALAPDPQPIRGHFCSGPDQEGLGYLEFLRHCDQYNRALIAQAAAEGDGRPLATLGSPTAGVIPAGQPSGIIQSLQESNAAALRTGGGPAYLINLEQALELSLFNSREFQDRREDLYLTALPITLERFQFVTQFFAGIEAVRSWAASEAPGGPGSAWTITSTGRASQLFPSGASLITTLANRLVIDLTHGNPTVGISTLTLSLTQPLLRGGGWAVTLEPLTQAERNLVYGVRAFARFRENYYVYIAGGGEVTNAPYGLQLSSSVERSLQAPSQGYLPTILAIALERNERENLRALTDYFTLYREYQGRGDFSELQVGQVEQQILSSQSSLLTRQQTLQGTLDSFKLQLGVPTQTPLQLDEGPLKPIENLLAAATRARDEYQALRAEADQFRAGLRLPLQALLGSVIAPIPLDVPLREKITDLVLNSPVTRATKEFKAAIPARWDRWRRMTTEQLRAEIKRLSDELRDLQVLEARYEARNEPVPPAEAARLDFLPKDLALGQLELSLRAYQEARLKPQTATARDVAVLYEDAVNNMMRVMNEPRMERRVLLRGMWPALPGVTVDGVDMLKADLDRAQTVAAQTALANRIELMNARGLTVDAWRRINVVANSLLGVLNVGYNLTSPSDANQPFALGGARSRHELILTGELPLVRRAERNSYRTALIAYQRARRNLQATEDFILNDVRTDLRVLRVAAENYRIQQRAIEVAYDQVENSLDVLQAPPQPDQGGAAGAAARPGQAAAQGQQQAANAASLTNQLLSAQNLLLRTQNALYTVWVDYLVARMTFYRDIERLPLDLRGVWIDESCSPPAVQPEILPVPTPVEAAEPGRFADLRVAGGG